MHYCLYSGWLAGLNKTCTRKFPYEKPLLMKSIGSGFLSFSEKIISE